MSKAPLRVLCFGDSLTSGYHAWGTGSHPYSTILARRLHEAFPGRRIEVSTSGVPGDVVCGPRFHERLSSEWAKDSYDWTIILAGTNDIARPSTAEDIVEALQEAWDTPLSRGGKVLAMTVPESKSRVAWATYKRTEINESILSHEAPNQYVHGLLYAFDLHAAIPYHALTTVDRHKYWDDGVHLTPHGYDWMGGHIASHLVSLLGENSTPSSAPLNQPGSAVNGSGGGAEIEEEAGDPKRLSKGYVFVRKRDLD